MPNFQSYRRDEAAEVVAEVVAREEVVAQVVVAVPALQVHQAHQAQALPAPDHLLLVAAVVPRKFDLNPIIQNAELTRE